MSGHAFTLADVALRALPSGALHWPDAKLLCVSDLHLGKSERLARRAGMLLPPYDTRATLARLDSDLSLTGARTVVCLGDSFDDLTAADALEETDRLWLVRLMAGRSWVWIEGNHDPGPLDLGGSHRAELTLPPLTFRHIAVPGPEPVAEPAADPATMAEVSGHYHPKARLAGLSRPCFLLDRRRLILPAYGSYTGGLDCGDAAFDALFGPGARAILTGARAHVLPRPARGGDGISQGRAR